MNRRTLAPLGIALGIAVGLCGAATGRAAPLAEQAPKGLSLSGSWRIDAARSDDPQVAVSRLRQSLDARKPPRERFSGAQHRPGDGPEDDSGERLFYELAVDAQREQRTRQLEQFAEILRNPPRIDVQQGPDSINFVADYDRLECVPGETVAVTDSSGTGKRNCGWIGSALVVQLKGQRGSLLERRYELGAGGTELIYTTSLNAEKLPAVKLRRVYRRSDISAVSGPQSLPNAGVLPAH